MPKAPYLRRDEPSPRDYRFARSWTEALGPHASCTRGDFRPPKQCPLESYYFCLIVASIACVSAIAYITLTLFPL